MKHRPTGGTQPARSDRRGVRGKSPGVLVPVVDAAVRLQSGLGRAAVTVADATLGARSRGRRGPATRADIARSIVVGCRSLPAPYREVMLLHHVHAASVEATCAAIGRDIATVRTQLARGRGLLRAALTATLGRAAWL